MTTVIYEPTTIDRYGMHVERHDPPPGYPREATRYTITLDFPTVSGDEGDALAAATDLLATVAEGKSALVADINRMDDYGQDVRVHELIGYLEIEDRVTVRQFLEALDFHHSRIVDDSTGETALAVARSEVGA